jgi:hypothetical protein
LIPFLTLLDPDDENKTMVCLLSFGDFPTIDVHDLLFSSSSYVKGAAYIEHAKKRMPPGEL